MRLPPRFVDQEVSLALGVGEDLVPLSHELLGLLDFRRNEAPKLLDQIQQTILVHQREAAEGDPGTFHDQLFDGEEGLL